MKLDPTEAKLAGKWILGDQGTIVGDDMCRRIDALVRTHLKELERDASGWETLYRDPDDGRLWELTYPQSALHGGGPPQLRCLSVDEAQMKYGRNEQF